MASIWKHPESKYFFARFVDVNGKWRNKTTRSTNAKQALRIAEAFEAVARKRLTSLHVRDTIAALQKEITGENLRFQTLREFCDSWLTSKTPEVAAATLAFYQKTISKFTDFLGAKADAELGAITNEDIIAFRNHEAKTLAAKTVNHDLKCLRMLFRAARQEKLITEDPSEFVKTTKKAGKTQRRRPFTIPELQAVVAVAGDEWRSMILFGLYTGQRLGDVASLTWENVDLARGEIRLITRKNQKSLILPIAQPLRTHIEGMKAGDNPEAPLHPRAYATVDRQGRSGNLSNQFADLLAQAGLRKKKPHRRTSADGAGRGIGSGSSALSFHCIRHTAVSLMKDAGIPEAAVMELVGHDSEQMSAHYTHVGREALEKAAASLPRIV